jgi:hypothetical protein
MESVAAASHSSTSLRQAELQTLDGIEQFDRYLTSAAPCDRRAAWGWHLMGQLGRRQISFACSLTTAIAGCSLAIDGGHSPPGLQADGTYVLSDLEQQRSCDQLSARSLEIKRQMLDVSGRAIDKVKAGVKHDNDCPCPTGWVST